MNATVDYNQIMVTNGSLTFQNGVLDVDPEAVKQSSLEKNITKPHPHDVLAGRGNSINSHPGNQYFRSLVRHLKNEYVITPKPEKPVFAKLILKHIKALQPPGRFLKKNGDKWEAIDEKKAVDKTRQALREDAEKILDMINKGTRRVTTNVRTSMTLKSPPTSLVDEGLQTSFTQLKQHQTQQMIQTTFPISNASLRESQNNMHVNPVYSGGLNGLQVNQNASLNNSFNGINNINLNGSLNGGNLNGSFNGGNLNGSFNGGNFNGNFNGGNLNGNFNGVNLNGSFNGGNLNGNFNGGNLNSSFNGGSMNNSFRSVGETMPYLAPSQPLGAVQELNTSSNSCITDASGRILYSGIQNTNTSGRSLGSHASTQGDGLLAPVTYPQEEKKMPSCNDMTTASNGTQDTLRGKQGENRYEAKEDFPGSSGTNYPMQSHNQYSNGEEKVPRDSTSDNSNQYLEEFPGGSTEEYRSSVESSTTSSLNMSSPRNESLDSAHFYGLDGDKIRLRQSFVNDAQQQVQPVQPPPSRTRHSLYHPDLESCRYDRRRSSFIASKVLEQLQKLDEELDEDSDYEEEEAKDFRPKRKFHNDDQAISHFRGSLRQSLRLENLDEIFDPHPQSKRADRRKSTRMSLLLRQSLISSWANVTEALPDDEECTRRSIADLFNGKEDKRRASITESSSDLLRKVFGNDKEDIPPGSQKEILKEILDPHSTDVLMTSILSKSVLNESLAALRSEYEQDEDENPMDSSNTPLNLNVETGIRNLNML